MINQLKCASGRSRYEFYDLANYGCWCGIGGSGRPVDRIDRCCWAHDKCYEESRTQNFKCNPKNILYGWHCLDKNRIGVCENIIEKDSSYKVKCANAVCNCDRLFSICVSRGKMNRKYHKISKRNVELCRKRPEISNFFEGLYWEVVED